MDRILNLLIDIFFYGFIDSIIIYLYIKNFNNEFSVKIKETSKNALCISILISLCSLFIPIVSVSQICMAIVVSLYFRFIIKKNILKTIMCVLISITFIFIFENCFGIFVGYLVNQSIFTLELNNIYRLTSYAVAKIIEIGIYLVWRKIAMKVSLAATTKR